MPELTLSPPTNPAHSLHQHPWPNQACFDASQVIYCDGQTDTRRCYICGKEWIEACNMSEECA